MRRFSIALLIAVTILPILQGCACHSVNNYAIHVYTRSDACGASEMWALYLGNYHQEDLKGTAVYGDPGLAEAVRKDSLGIGYNNLNYAYDMETGNPISGLRLIPIDLNENGKIDAEEDFYNTKADLMHAIATGLYPSPPARNEHLVTKSEFTGLAKEFVRWILTDGQQYCAEVGYIALSKEEVEAELSKLGEAEPQTRVTGELTVSGAWALYPMMVKWAEEFRKIYPGITIHVSAGGAGKGMADALGGLVDIGMVSREIYPAEVEKGAFAVSVTKDAVVPVVNENNPVLQDLLVKGMTRETFADIWITEKITDWREVVR